MNLHKTVAGFIATQNNHDSQAYVENFSETAIVHDEGKTHRGKTEISEWFKHTDSKYQSVLKPLHYQVNGNEHVLKAEVSGTFPGSPAILKFHLGLDGDLICTLSVTG